MNTLQTLEMALEALEHASYCVQTDYLPDKMGHDWDEVIASLRTQIALEKQKPAAWVGLTMEDKQEYVAQDYGGNRLDAMDWAEKRLKEKNT